MRYEKSQLTYTIPSKEGEMQLLMNLTTVFFLISRAQILMRFVIPFCDTNVDIGEVATYLLSGIPSMFFLFLDEESGDMMSSYMFVSMEMHPNIYGANYDLFVLVMGRRPKQ